MVMIISECGVNHDGDLSKALRLCDAAKQTGADAAKFQTYIPEYCIRRSKDFDLLCALALPLHDFITIAKHCESIGIEFMSTPDDINSLKYLVEECGIRRIKIGSGSLTYLPLVHAAYLTKLPVLLGTGMATQDEIRAALPWFSPYETYEVTDDLTLMHCVSLYPCPPHLANVRAMNHLREIGEGVAVGYRDRKSVV